MAKEAWKKLQTIFSSSSRTQIQQLQTQLKHLIEGIDCIDSYMQKARSIYDQLAALQPLISEDVLVGEIIEGLGSVYHPFTRALKAHHAPINFDDLYALLLSRKAQLNLDALTVDNSIPLTTQVITKTQNYRPNRGGRG